jgi:hypothetical protein
MAATTENSKDERTRKLAQVLRQVFFFSTFSMDELYTIVAEERLIKWKRFQKGNVILKQGTFDQHFYIIIQGKIEIIRPEGVQKEAPVGTQTEGEIFGEMVVCAPDKPRRASVQVAGDDDVVVCEIDATLVEKAPAPLKVKFLKKFLDNILERLRPAERGFHFYEEIIRYAGESKAVPSDEYFLYTIETAAHDNNRLTQYIKYTDFFINRRTSYEKTIDLLQSLLIQATDKLIDFYHAT